MYIFADENIYLVVSRSLSIKNLIYMSNTNTAITNETIKEFLEGRDPQERIVNLDYKYSDSFITVYYRDENDVKCAQRENFYPFVWATRFACTHLCEGNRNELKQMLQRYGIGVKKLSNTNYKGEKVEEFENGYMFMFYAIKPMSYTKFLNFFRTCKNPIYNRKDKNGKTIVSCPEQERQYLIVSPQEQFLISSGKRFFKGYDDYDCLLRMIFDLETEGLDPTKHRIKLNGVKLNRDVTVKGKTYHNWGRIFRLDGTTEEEKNASELKIIDTMLRLIYTFKPDVITAHNGENFDWNFLITRCKMLGTTMEDMSAKYFGGECIRKEEKESVLKLGGEVETFYRTIVPGVIITDSLHAVRRAQATDSNFKKATLKYSTKYLHLKKQNRVYTPGNEIDKVLTDTENIYCFNNTDGDWYRFKADAESDTSGEFKKGKDGDKPFIIYNRNYIAEGYEYVTGQYIIERYLLDDLWECDKVESKLNTANFFICKILPLPFSKCCTMGTAGQWKSIMLAWSFENNLAIPIADSEKLTVGGLSRLLNVGFSKDIVKLDYNSLYPSITLTWGIEDWQDLSGVTLKMLEYVLTTRELYKGLKKTADKIVSKYDEMIKNGVELTHEQNEEYEKAKAEFSINDKIQNSFKTLGNSYFGSVSATNPSVYPWKSSKSGHRITSTGRQCLRLMISHFHDIKGPNGETEGYGYKPLVGDSVTGDTPLFIKYKDTGYIDIKPIEEIMDVSNAETDNLGRKYDTSIKPYQVLCRNGWKDIEYVYCHKTDKDIYEVSDGNSMVECTQDHSLFDSQRNEIKPTEISNETTLEYYTGEIEHNVLEVNFADIIIKEQAKQLANGIIDRVPYTILNADTKTRTIFYKEFIKHQNTKQEYSKTCLAGIQYITKKEHE